MKNINKFLNKSKKTFRFIATILRMPFKIPLIIEQNKFILYELCRLNELIRFEAIEDKNLIRQDFAAQTSSSFDYQWKEFNYGDMLPDDEDFMSGVENEICMFTGTGRAWFDGKNVLDIGCGTGRFTCGFLNMGARVCASDQSEWALKSTAKLCEKFSDRLTCKQADVLDWKDKGDYDLVFAFGLVHHTGNTYQAIINTANKVRNKGGKLFLMVYGFPETLRDFMELNRYEELRSELRNLPANEKKQVLIDRFGARAAHGFFDAVSPRINDLLTFREIEELLLNLGFKNIKKTIKNRNHHIIAEKI